MRKITCSFLVLVIISTIFISCKSDRDEANVIDSIDFDAVNAESYLLKEVPELEEYANYISEKSNGEAELVVDVVWELKEIEDISGNYYAVYVGEQWEDHNVNWDWFYVSSELDNIYWYYLVEDDYLTLEEWRDSAYYRQLDD